MTLSVLGTSTSLVEVTNISKHGFWLFVDGAEYFLAFVDFPWFQTAPVNAIINVARVHQEHLYWPDLDVDLELSSIRTPQDYPLVARTTTES